MPESNTLEFPVFIYAAKTDKTIGSTKAKDPPKWMVNSIENTLKEKGRQNPLVHMGADVKDLQDGNIPIVQTFLSPIIVDGCLPIFDNQDTAHIISSDGEWEVKYGELTMIQLSLPDDVKDVCDKSEIEKVRIYMTVAERTGRVDIKVSDLLKKE